MCSIPLTSRSIPMDHPIYQRLWAVRTTLIGEIFAILRRYNVNFKDMDFQQRKSTYDPSAEPVLTAFVVAVRSEVDNTWLQASREIRALLKGKGFPELAVEIADPAAFEVEKYSPVLKTDAIFDKWYEVCGTILREVQLRDITTIGCWRVGRKSDTSLNPPTVVVTVSLKSTGVWKGTRETIVNILNRFNLQTVAVEIIKGEVIRSVYFSCDVVRGPAMLGQSLAPSGNDKSSGTLGGFIQLKSPTTGQWRTYALTCFHCVLPEDAHLPANVASREYLLLLNQNPTAF